VIHHREELIRERTQRKNKLTAICDELFPEFTRICKDPNSPSALALRAAFPTPSALAMASMTALKAARHYKSPSDARLRELQGLGARSIGTHDLARLRGLTVEQSQLIAELHLLDQHIQELDAEIAQVIATTREGRILTSIPGIGQTLAASLVALIGNIANFERPSQLKAYCGWAPTLTQSGKTLDRVRLTPRGVRILKQALYLAALQAIRLENNEFARLYASLVPRKCAYDERKREYIGKNKVVGRVAGQLITVLFTLLKRDQEIVTSTRATALPEPIVYDPALHRSHRSGHYPTSPTSSLGTIVRLPSK
jgi:hypothetical protein